ncbi:MAG: tyrosine-type recombinase/integrase [Hyphomicrobiaceae bacterium]
MLTDLKIRATIATAIAKQKTQAIRDRGKTACLELRASYGGTASFAYLYLPKGGSHPQRVKLGTYGANYGLADARRDAAVLAGKRAAGIDPLLERASHEEEARQRQRANEEAEAARLSRKTFDDIAQLYLSRDNIQRQKKWRLMYEKNVRGLIGGKAMEEITCEDVQSVVDALTNRSARIQARRVFELVRAILRLGVSRGAVTGTPWRGVELPENSRPCERVLSAQEIEGLLKKSKVFWVADPNKWRIIWLMLLLGQRPSEVAQMERAELSDDLFVWTIPGRRTKNGNTHAVPLPPMARELLQQALDVSPSPTHVFVGARLRPERADTLDKKVVEFLQFNTKRQYAKINSFRPHDLRRTVLTGMEIIGVARPIISACANHISDKNSNVTSKHYLHGDKSAEIRKAFTLWQGAIEAILDGRDPLAPKVMDIRLAEEEILQQAKLAFSK